MEEAVASDSEFSREEGDLPPVSRLKNFYPLFSFCPHPSSLIPPKSPHKSALRNGQANWARSLVLEHVLQRVTVSWKKRVLLLLFKGDPKKETKFVAVEENKT
ncbi:hypothetical protein TNCT_478411 [Trichonephila clavata]|uniref:Uncharacterized protein n=1 Tax=Trichonephila clavata TaxID=2740835 RepID=A0A8X6FVY5_TRICU|nr:hypothetical protein TNCT_478411 [Trichonephila clavata]